MRGLNFNLPKISLPILVALPLLLTALSCYCPAPGRADDSLNKGIALYNARDYKAASKVLYQAASAQQGPTVTYYLALTYEKLNYHSQALELFTRIGALWPGTEEARLADDYVKKLNEIAAADKEKAAAEAKLTPGQRLMREFHKPLTRAQWEALPNKVRFPIARERGHLMVTAKVNGKYCKMVFDTGASSCTLSITDYPDVISRAQLESAKQVPVNRPNGMVMHRMTDADVSVNDLTRNVRMLATTEPGVSVIGQNFFKEYTYQVDDFYVRLTKSAFNPDEPVVAARPAADASVEVTGTRAGGAGAKPGVTVINGSVANAAVGSKAVANASAASSAQKKFDRYTIPFEKISDCMLIDIEINGYKTKAIFDTGCAPDGVVCHPSLVDLAHLTHATRMGNRADRVVVGSIIKMDVPVYYANGLQYPLVGPKFFARPFTVDQVEKCIRFDW